jgi:hypothetical protein
MRRPKLLQPMPDNGDGQARLAEPAQAQIGHGV